MESELTFNICLNGQGHNKLIAWYMNFIGNKLASELNEKIMFSILPILCCEQKVKNKETASGKIYKNDNVNIRILNIYILKYCCRLLNSDNIHVCILVL